MKLSTPLMMVFSGLEDKVSAWYLDNSCRRTFVAYIWLVSGSLYLGKFT